MVLEVKTVGETALACSVADGGSFYDEIWLNVAEVIARILHQPTITIIYTVNANLSRRLNLLQTVHTLFKNLWTMIN